MIEWILCAFYVATEEVSTPDSRFLAIMFSTVCMVVLYTAITLAAPNDAATRGFEKVGALSRMMSEQEDLSVTQNELALCRPVTVIFARGTNEPGNVGSLVGPPFFKALDLALGEENLAVQGIDYPATISGYLKGGDSKGTEKLASVSEEAAKQCPDTQIVLSGYSQGAQLVHNGAAELSAEIAARVAAVVLFGDPFKDRPLPNIDASKVKTFCYVDDRICKNTIFVSISHLAYAMDAVPAAQFVASKVKV